MKGMAVMPFLSVCVGVAAQQKQMNVIYIMSDDHTSQAIGAYGSRLAVLNPTPTIDELARDGMLFENCFCTNSISTPSRACIMTGQYSHRNKVLTLDEVLQPDQEYLVDEFHNMGFGMRTVALRLLFCIQRSWRTGRILRPYFPYK